MPWNTHSIALIGASDRAGSVGDVLAANLLAGGFKGQLMFVNPKGRPVHGQEVAISVAALPQAPDLAVIATPAGSVAGLERFPPKDARNDNRYGVVGVLRGLMV